jgi:hypothetical protein
MSKVKELSQEVEEVQGPVAEQAQAQEEQKPNALVISLELANALAEYISRPSKEVEQLVNALKNSRQVTVQEEAQA